MFNIQDAIYLFSLSLAFRRLDMKFGKWLGGLLCVLVLLCFAQASLADTSDYDPRFITPSQVSLTDWMARIPNEALITEINMPGSHDAGTAHMNWGISYPLAVCQDWTISEQL